MRFLPFAVATVLSTVATAASPVVDLGYSKYEGTSLSNGISQWLGIRFAAPPVGNLRFRAPKDPVPVSEIQIADKHGPICLATKATKLSNKTAEDCLFLDVYAPTSTGNSKKLLPVYVFIQGGGFNTLSNANFNGSGLIAASDKNIVIVTFNYRVGPYGFLTSKEVQEDGDLNNGLKDQRKVFEWVQSHISKFGGDPNHVTIGGDSAGAASVSLQLSAYGGRDDKLFHAAAAESVSYARQLNISQSQYQYDALVERTGCSTTSDTLECLRNLSVKELQAENINIPTPGVGGTPPLYMYSPVIDGDFCTDFTYTLFAEGKFIKVPTIMGADSNDGTIFTPNTTNSVEEMNQFLREQFPALTPSQLAKIDELYPKGAQFPDSGQYWRSVSDVYGNMRYMCPGMSITNAYALKHQPAWNYHYNVIDPPSAASGLGVSHTIEINAIWGPENVNGGAPASYSSPLNRNAIKVMQGYWTSFIRAYDPNVYRAKGTPFWGQWVPKLETRIRIETNTTTMEVVDAALKERCAFLEGIGVAIQQ